VKTFFIFQTQDTTGIMARLMQLTTAVVVQVVSLKEPL